MRVCGADLCAGVSAACCTRDVLLIPFGASPAVTLQTVHSSSSHTQCTFMKTSKLEQFLLYLPCLFIVGVYVIVLRITFNDTHTPQSVGLLWTSDQPITETSTRQQATLTMDGQSCQWQD